MKLCKYDLLSITNRKRRFSFGIASFFSLALLLAALSFALPSAAHAQSSDAHKPVAQPVQLGSVKMLSSSKGWALSNDKTRVFVTKDGPAHWTDVTPTGFTFTNDDVMNSITSSFFLDAQHGYLGILQDGVTSFLSTHDGGKSWQSVALDIDSLIYTPAYQIDFIDASHGWLAIDIDHGFGRFQVALMRTSDGGKTWQKILDTTLDPSGLPTSDIKNFSFTSQQDGWMSGPEEDPSVRLYATHDGGVTWAPAQIPSVTIPDTTYTQSYGPFFNDNGRQGTVTAVSGVATSNSTYLTTFQTSDSGKTWKQVGDSLVSGDTVGFRQVAFTNASNGWVMGLNVKGQPLLVHTTDGGQHWSAFLPSPSGLHPFTEVVMQLSFLNNRDGLVIDKTDDNTWTLFQTHDGGADWQVVNPTAVKP